MTDPTSSLDKLSYRPFTCMSPDTPLSEAGSCMDREGLEKAVVMEGRTLLGILSLKDRLRAINQQVPSGTPVRELMTGTCRTLSQSTAVRDAYSHLLEPGAVDLVVIDDLGKPLGLLEEQDLLRCATALSQVTGADIGLLPRTLAEHGRTRKQQTDLLCRFASTLINLPANSCDAAVNNTLMQMGRLVQVDRAYIFRYDFDAGITINTHEWCAPGISPQIDRLQSVPVASVPEWVSPHKRAECLVVNDVEELPANRLREILEAQDIKSLISLPIMGNDSCLGFLGFDSVRSKREYGSDDLDVLGLFARTLANYQERVDAERKLANSEANFHAFFDQTRDLLFVVSNQGRIVECNAQAARVLGVSEKELRGEPVLQFYPEECRAEAASLVATMATDRVNHFAIPMQDWSGRSVPVQTSVSAGQWNGAPALFMVCRDLSEITASEEKFSKAFHLSSMPTVIADQQQGTLLEVNDAFFNVMGYERHETIGKSVSAIGLFDDQTQWDAITRQLQQLGQVDNIETPLRTRQRHIVYGLFNAAMLELQGRRVVICQVLDITSRKAAEEALDHERRQLRTLINSQPNLVWLKDPDGVYMTCNAVFESMLGMSESDVTGKTDFDLVDKELAEFFRKHDRLAVEAGRTCVNEEYLTFASNDYQGLFETTKTPIFKANGKLIGVLGIARDITEEREAEDKRRRVERELHQSHKMEALGQLSGGVAHEFNNMLAIILGYKDLIQNRLGHDIDPSLNSWLEHIDVAGIRSKELVRQLLSFSRPRETQSRRMNLETGVRSAIVLSQSSLPSSIEIDYRPASVLPDVRLDAGELQQMLTNLLVNARDAMGGKGRIEVTLRHTRFTEQECQVCHTLLQGDWLELGIADNGPGIDPDQQSRIFEPFYTTKSVGKGTGLGLSMVSSAVERNGGHILLDTAAGRGTRFRLLFPALEFETQEARPVPERVAAPSIEGVKVLIVDDEPAITEFLQQALEMQGLHVVALNNSREALDLLLGAEQSFDVLITDQTMPGMLGTELVVQAKSHQRGLKVILCTGHSERINANNAAEFGIDVFLEKPLSIQDMVIAIDKLSQQIPVSG